MKHIQFFEHIKANLMVVVLSSLIIVLAACTVTAPTGPDYSVSDLDIRQLVYVSELHWAGTVDNGGNNDNPDDDFVEISNFYSSAIGIGGWTIVVSGSRNHEVVIPSGTTLQPGAWYTIGRTTSGAFSHLDLVDPDFSLPNAGFTLEIKDGAGRVSDTAVFSNSEALPGGCALPLMRKSAVRRMQFFGPEPGDLVKNWKTYGVSQASSNVRSTYSSAVFCSPGDEIDDEADF